LLSLLSGQAIGNGSTSPPADPDDLNVSTYSKEELLVTWSDNSTDEERFYIERSETGTGGWTQIGYVLTNVTTYLSVDLNAATRYYYRVRAWKSTAVNYSDYTNPIDDAWTLCHAPGTPSVTIISASQLKPTWSAVTGATGYKVYRSTSSGSGYAQVGGTITTLYYNDSGLSANTPYYYKIVAVNQGGDSAFSSYGSAATLPTVPQNFQVKSRTTNSVTFEWTDVNGETGYTFHEYAEESYYNDVDLSANVTEHTVNATNGYEIPAKIRWYNSYGNGSYTDVISGYAAPTTPASMTATAFSQTQIDLTWSNVANEYNYRVERSPNGSTGWTPIATKGTNVTSHSDTSSLSAGTQYFYRVIPYNPGGDGGSSPIANTWTVTQAPVMLDVVALSTTSLRVMWYPSNGADYYRVYRSSTGGGGTFSQVGGDISSTLYVDSGLNAGTIYYYQVTAFTDDDDESAASATDSNLTWTVGTLNLTATTESTTEIGLSWSNLTGNGGYVVEWSPDGINTWEELATTIPDETSYDHEELDPASHYFYRIWPINSPGGQGYSDVADGWTYAEPPVTVQAVAVSTDHIDVSWNDVEGESGYEVEHSPDGESPWTSLDLPDEGVTQYSHLQLSPATEHYYRIRAYNAGGAGPWSSEVGTYTLAEGPASLTATAISNTEIDLAWGDASGESQYVIERRRKGIKTWETIQTLSADSTSHSDTDLSSGTLYLYRVRSDNSGGEGLYSNVAQDCTIPARPLIARAMALSHTAVQLDWYDVLGDQGYRVERWSGTDWTSMATVSQDVQYYVDENLTTGTQYTYRVAAFNVNGESPYSSATTALTWSDAPRITSLQTLSTESLHLKWSEVSAADYYRIYRSVTGDPGEYTLIADQYTTITFTDTELDEANAYFYKVSGHRSTGFTAQSEPVQTWTQPLQPAELNVAQSSATTFTLTWDDMSEGEDGYHVYRGWPQTVGGIPLDIRQTGVLLGTLSADAESFNDSVGQTDGLVRLFTVCAYIDEVISTPVMCQIGTALEAPSELKATTPTALSVLLTWQDNSRMEQEYLVQRDSDPPSSWTTIAYLAGNSTAYKDEVGLTAEQTYYYRVRARHSTIADSDYSTSVSIVVPDHAMALGNAMDGDPDAWETDNDPEGWQVTTADIHFGRSALVSGDISHGETSVLSRDVEGPGTIRFFWAVSSEKDHDFLSFYVDGDLIEQISGETGWREVIYELDPGSHTVSIVFSKDGSRSAGLDRGLIDSLHDFILPKVEATPTPTPEPTPSPTPTPEPVPIFTVHETGEAPPAPVAEIFDDGSMEITGQLFEGQTSLAANEDEDGWLVYDLTEPTPNLLVKVPSSGTDQGNLYLRGHLVSPFSSEGTNFQVDGPFVQRGRDDQLLAAVDDDGDLYLSSGLSLPLPALETPTTPTAYGFDYDKMRILWTPIERATGYIVERSDNGTSNWEPIADVSDSSLIDDDLSIGVDDDPETFFYKVKAYNTGETTSYSPVGFGTTQQRPKWELTAIYIDNQGTVNIISDPIFSVNGEEVDDIDDGIQDNIFTGHISEWREEITFSAEEQTETSGYVFKCWIINDDISNVNTKRDLTWIMADDFHATSVFEPFVVVRVSPENESTTAEDNQDIVVTFNSEPDSATVNNHADWISVRGSMRGEYALQTPSVSNGQLTFEHSTSFLPGETIEAGVRNGEASDGSDAALEHIWKFHVKPGKVAESIGFEIFEELQETTHVLTALAPVTFRNVASDPLLTVIAVYATSPTQIFCLPTSMVLTLDQMLESAPSEPETTGTTAIAIGNLDQNDTSNGDRYRPDVVVVKDGFPIHIYLAGQDDNWQWQGESYPHIHFASRQTIDQGEVTARAVALGDVDGDGDLDIVVGNDGARNRIYYNQDGMGTFAADTTHAFGSSTGRTFAIALADMDLDGDLDIVEGNNGSANYIRYNDGRGRFSVPGNQRRPGDEEEGATPQDDHWFNYGTGTVTLTYVNDAERGRVVHTSTTGTGESDARSMIGDRLVSPFNPNDVAWEDNERKHASIWVRNTDATDRPMRFYFDVETDEQRRLILYRTITADDPFINGQQEIECRIGASYNDGQWYYIAFDLAAQVEAIGETLEQVNALYIYGNDYYFDDFVLSDGTNPPNRTHEFGTGYDLTTSLAVGRINPQDDSPDILVGNFGEPNRVYLRQLPDDDEYVIHELSDADGRKLSGRTSSVILADLDGDADPDIVVGNEGNEVNRIYRTESEDIAVPEELVEFTAMVGPGRAPYPQNDTRALAVMDADLDGGLEIIVGNADGKTGIYYNRPFALENPVLDFDGDTVGSYLYRWAGARREDFFEESTLLGPTDAVGSGRVEISNFLNQDPVIATDGDGHWVAVWSTTNPLEYNSQANELLDGSLPDLEDHQRTYLGNREKLPDENRYATEYDRDIVISRLWDKRGSAQNGYSPETEDDWNDLRMDPETVWTPPVAIDSAASQDMWLNNDPQNTTQDLFPDIATNGQGLWLCVWGSFTGRELWNGPWGGRGDSTYRSDPEHMFSLVKWGHWDMSDLHLAVSSDHGLNWASHPYTIQLPNITAEIELLKLGRPRVACSSAGNQTRWIVMFPAASVNRAGDPHGILSDYDIYYTSSVSTLVSGTWQWSAWTSPKTLTPSMTMAYDGFQYEFSTTDAALTPIQPMLRDPAHDVFIPFSDGYDFALYEYEGMEQINSYKEECSLQMSTNGEGIWIAVWPSNTPRVTEDADRESPIDVGHDYDLFFSVSTDDGLTWSEPHFVNSQAASSSDNWIPTSDSNYGDWDIRPSLAYLGNGSWIVIWEKLNDVYYYRGPGADWNNSRLNSFTRQICMARVSVSDIMEALTAAEGESYFGYTPWDDEQIIFGNTISEDDHVDRIEPEVRDSRYDYPSEPTVSAGSNGLIVAMWRMSERPATVIQSYVASAISVDYGETWSINEDQPLMGQRISERFRRYNRLFIHGSTGTDDYSTVHWTIGPAPPDTPAYAYIPNFSIHRPSIASDGAGNFIALAAARDLDNKESPGFFFSTQTDIIYARSAGLLNGVLVPEPIGFGDVELGMPGGEFPVTRFIDIPYDFERFPQPTFIPQVPSFDGGLDEATIFVGEEHIQWLERKDGGQAHIMLEDPPGFYQSAYYDDPEYGDGTIVIFHSPLPLTISRVNRLSLEFVYGRAKDTDDDPANALTPNPYHELSVFLFKGGIYGPDEWNNPDAWEPFGGGDQWPRIYPNGENTINLSLTRNFHYYLNATDDTDPFGGSGGAVTRPANTLTWAVYAKPEEKEQFFTFDYVRVGCVPNAVTDTPDETEAVGPLKTTTLTFRSEINAANVISTNSPWKTKGKGLFELDADPESSTYGLICHSLRLENFGPNLNVYLGGYTAAGIAESESPPVRIPISNLSNDPTVFEATDVTIYEFTENELSAGDQTFVDKLTGESSDYLAGEVYIVVEWEKDELNFTVARGQLEVDWDDDGLTHPQELAYFGEIEESPYDRDTDDDGLFDGEEALGLWRLTPYGPIDKNRNDEDSDDDGLTDSKEAGLSVGDITAMQQDDQVTKDIPGVATKTIKSTDSSIVPDDDMIDADTVIEE
jgi:fibronectin type 3 domain-containing protein